MAVFEINKGVGRSVEFKGLKAQYLFIFAGGLLATFIVVVILYMIGVNQLVCLLFGACAAEASCPKKSRTKKPSCGFWKASANSSGY